MKSYLLIFVFLMMPLLARASSTVCSSEKLYYSAVRADFGTQPPPNTITGSTTIVYSGDVLLHYNSVQGLFPHGVPPYQVDLIGPVEVLAKEGGQISGAQVSRQVAVLRKVDSLNPSNVEELARESVICRSTWKFVP